MKIVMLVLSLLLFTGGLFAQGSASLDASRTVASPAPKPTTVACKAKLKAWSGPESKTSTLTIEQLKARMSEMVACADEARHHWHSDKQVLMYLERFYHTHAELADRAFDFIANHKLTDQFEKEEGSAVNSESAANKTEEKP